MKKIHMQRVTTTTIMINMEKIHMQRDDDNNNYDNKSKYGKDLYAKSDDNNNYDNKSKYGKDPYAKS